MKWTLAVAGLVVASMLAGCTGPGGAPQAVLLTRDVRIELSPEDMGGNSLKALLEQVKTTFVYTHEGDAAEVAGAQVEYVDASGAKRTQPLSAFTDKTTLSAGDAVRITGAAVASDVRILKGDLTLGQRTGLRGAWLQAEDQLLPIAAKPGGRMEYDSTSSATVTLAVDRGAYHCTDPSCSGDVSVEDVRFSESLVADGTIGVLATAQGQDLNLSFAAKLDGKADVTAQARVTMEGEQDGQRTETSFDAGFDFEGKASLDGRVDLLFKDGKVLSQAGGMGRVHGTAKFTAWDLEHARSEGWQPRDIGPFDETQPYTVEKVEAKALAAQAKVAAALYDISLVPGDAFLFSIDLGEEGMSGTITHEVTALAYETRTIAGHELKTLKVHTRFLMSFQVPGQAEELQAFESTYWIDAATYFPVESTFELRKTLSRADFDTLLDTLAMLAPEGVELPQAIELVLDFKGTTRTTQYAEGLLVSPIVTSGGALMLPVMAGMMASGMASDMGPEHQGLAGPGHEGDPGYHG